MISESRSGARAYSESRLATAGIHLARRLSKFCVAAGQQDFGLRGGATLGLVGHEVAHRAEHGPLLVVGNLVKTVEHHHGLAPLQRVAEELARPVGPHDSLPDQDLACNVLRDSLVSREELGELAKLDEIGDDSLSAWCQDVAAPHDADAIGLEQRGLA